MCFQDLAQYVNEVKRDNETLREIDQYQRSIENLVSFMMSWSQISKKKKKKLGFYSCLITCLFL